MVRDLEIQRLVNYAKGLGLRVTFTSKDDGDFAGWYIDNSGIIVNKKLNKSKIGTVLSLIHEIGHALHNIHERDREIDVVAEKALDHVAEAEENGEESKKRQRKILLDDEIAGTRYWHEIYRETNMKFPLWRLEAQMERDIWPYEYFYQNDEWPSSKEKAAKFTECLRKYRE